MTRDFEPEDHDEDEGQEVVLQPGEKMVGDANGFRILRPGDEGYDEA